MGKGRPQGGLQLFGLFHQKALGSVCSGQSHKIRIGVQTGGAVVLLVKKLLPLPDHAQIAVVQNDDLDRHLIADRRGQLLDVHLDGAVTGHIHHQPVGKGQLRADGRRESVAHGSEPARREQSARLAVCVELCGPHLVLAHFGGDDGLAPRNLENLFHHLLRFDPLPGLSVAQGMNGAHFRQGGVPFFVLGGPVHAGNPVRFLDEPLKPQFAVGHDGYVHHHVLADGRGIDVDMDDPGSGGEGADPARDPVVKAGAHGNEHVAAVHGHVGRIGAVHAEHAEPQGMVAGKSPKPHQRGGHRALTEFRQADQFGGAVGRDDAPSGVNGRPFGLGDEFSGLAQLLAVGAVVGIVAADVDGLGIGKFRGRGDHVLGQVDEDGARPPRPCYIEGLFDGRGQLRHILHQIVVLGARTGDAHDIGFLKGVVADEMRGHLAGDHDQRNGVHVGRGDTGHGIGRSGTGSHQAYAHLARCPGITVGRMHGGLFVTDQDMSERMIRELVVYVDDRTSGKTENEVNTFPLQAFHQNPGAGEHHGRLSLLAFIFFEQSLDAGFPGQFLLLVFLHFQLFRRGKRGLSRVAFQSLFKTDMRFPQSPEFLVVRQIRRNEFEVLLFHRTSP